MMSGDLDRLTPSQLAAAISAMITEPPRPDTWCNYRLCQKLSIFCDKERKIPPGLREVRRLLYQAQSRYDITIPVWLETQLMGIASRSAQGTSWQELCENTSLDEGFSAIITAHLSMFSGKFPKFPGFSQSLKIMPVLPSQP
jgi:superfamily II RNA helicase